MKRKLPPLHGGDELDDSSSASSSSNDGSSSDDGSSSENVHKVAKYLAVGEAGEELSDAEGTEGKSLLDTSHVSQVGRYFSADTTTSLSQGKCYRCGNQGHFARDCTREREAKQCMLCGDRHEAWFSFIYSSLLSNFVPPPPFFFFFCPLFLFLVLNF